MEQIEKDSSNQEQEQEQEQQVEYSITDLEYDIIFDLPESLLFSKEGI